MISHLQFMLEHPDKGDNHNAEPFAHCYRRMAELIPQLIDAGCSPRIMLDYSGTLLWGVEQVGRSDITEALRFLACDPEGFAGKLTFLSQACAGRNGRAFTRAIDSAKLEEQLLVTNQPETQRALAWWSTLLANPVRHPAPVKCKRPRVIVFTCGYWDPLPEMQTWGPRLHGLHRHRPLVLRRW